MALPTVETTKDFYNYVVDFIGLASGATTTQTFNIDTDSMFFLMKLTQQSDIAAAAVTRSANVIPLCTIQVNDGGSTRQLFSEPAPIPAVFGTGENPFMLPVPRQFSPGSTVSVTLSNYSAATTYNTRLVFSGAKHYRFG